MGPNVKPLFRRWRAQIDVHGQGGLERCISSRSTTGAGKACRFTSAHRLLHGPEMDGKHSFAGSRAYRTGETRHAGDDLDQSPDVDFGRQLILNGTLSARIGADTQG